MQDLSTVDSDLLPKPSPRPKTTGGGDFTLIKLLIVIAIIGALEGLVLPSMTRARPAGRKTARPSNLRQVSIRSRLYMDDHQGGLFHHHEGWVLDDGT